MRIVSQIRFYKTQIMNPMEKYLKSTETNIKVMEKKVTRGRKTESNILEKVILPKLQINKGSYGQLLQKSWKGKNLIFNVDPSAMIGLKRLYARNYLIKNVYKGVSEPHDMLNKQNPDHEKMIEELKFDPDIFFIMDQKLPSDLQDNIEDAICDLYERQPDRMHQRFRKQLRIPKQYCALIQAAMYNKNEIFFMGLNEYVFRNLLVSSYGLNELKSMFFECLEYGHSQSSEMNQFQDFARQYVYLKCYDVVHDIQTELFYQSAKHMRNSILFGPSYLLEGQEKNGKIRQTRNYNVDIQTDQKRIEKHALLEVLLGSLWTLPYTLNKFPYLSQDYFSLSQEDKVMVTEMFRNNVIRYKGAMKLFYEKVEANKECEK